MLKTLLFFVYIVAIQGGVVEQRFVWPVLQRRFLHYS